MSLGGFSGWLGHPRPKVRSHGVETRVDLRMGVSAQKTAPGIVSSATGERLCDTIGRHQHESGHLRIVVHWRVNR